MAGDWPTLGIALVIGIAFGAISWVALRPVFDHDALGRRNFRDRQIPVAGGLAVIVGVLAAGALWVVTDESLGTGIDPSAALAVGLAVLGFGLLGFVDDTLGSGRERGFRGHVSALARGRLSAGGLKLVGGGAVALIVASVAGSEPWAALLTDAVLIALAANFFNLLDLAPGRALKVGAATFAVVALAASGAAVLQAPAVAVGAAMALLWPDLREQVMLGDTGANPLGAVLGLALVLTTPPMVRLVVVIVLLALNAASEIVSFSRVIDRVPPLRMLDRLGRLP